MPGGHINMWLMTACSEIFQVHWFYHGVSFHYVGPFSLALICWFIFSLYTDTIYCILWVEYIACHVIQPLLCAFGSFEHVCFFCMPILLFHALFFLCVCQYILCDLYYYLILVCLDQAVCACTVYFLCIICCQVGPVWSSRLAPSNVLFVLSFDAVFCFSSIFVHIICLFLCVCWWKTLFVGL